AYQALGCYFALRPYDRFMSTKPDERKNSFEDLRAGEKVFECFEIVEKVGAGGMGTVYKAKNILMDRIVALKVVSGNKLQDKDLIRFQNEARTLSKLDHRNIAAVFDFGVALGRIPYIAMEFIDGRTMDQVLDGLPDGKMDVSSVCWLFIQICEALSHAHRKGVIHRDLKTSNIIISEDHRSKEMRAVVVDFGVAKIDTEDERHRVTTTGEFVGSPLYISPEQIGGRRADERSDIYSLGGIMFHCLAGRPP